MNYKTYYTNRQCVRRSTTYVINNKWGVSITLIKRISNLCIYYYVLNYTSYVYGCYFRFIFQIETTNHVGNYRSSKKKNAIILLQDNV